MMHESELIVADTLLSEGGVWWIEDGSTAGWWPSRGAALRKIAEVIESYHITIKCIGRPNHQANTHVKVIDEGDVMPLIYTLCADYRPGDSYAWVWDGVERIAVQVEARNVIGLMGDPA